MQIQLIESGEIIKGRGYGDIVRKFDPQLVDKQGIEVYMQEFKKRYFRMYGTILNFNDAKTFIIALNNDKKFLRLVNN
jgi:hypothetical protein